MCTFKGAPGSGTISICPPCLDISTSYRTAEMRVGVTPLDARIHPHVGRGAGAVTCSAFLLVYFTVAAPDAVLLLTALVIVQHVLLLSVKKRA